MNSDLKNNNPAKMERLGHVLWPAKFALFVTVLDCIVLAMLFSTNHDEGGNGRNQLDLSNLLLANGSLSSLENGNRTFNRINERSSGNVTGTGPGSGSGNGDVKLILDQVTLLHWYIAAIVVTVLGSVLGLILIVAFKVSFTVYFRYCNVHLLVCYAIHMFIALAARDTFASGIFNGPLEVLTVIVFSGGMTLNYLSSDRIKKEEKFRTARHTIENSRVLYTRRPPRVLIEQCTV